MCDIILIHKNDIVHFIIDIGGIRYEFSRIRKG